MSTITTSQVSQTSTLVDVPGVTSAVQHLQELGSRMRGEEFGFKEEDVQVLDDIIQCVHEVHDECKKVHEKLETETIKSSIVRHRLQFLPGLIKKEIAAAIASARQSNANELNRLQSELARITASIELTTAKHKEIERANSSLLPERNKVRQEHEDIIAQLNFRMAEKANKQIALNETRDKVRETNQKIVDLEEGIIQLKEDLIQERANARMEKKRLKKAVYDTTVKTREQKEINIDKRSEVDALYSRVTDLEGQLTDFRKTIRQMETSRSKLEGMERGLTAQFARQVNTNQDLRIKGLEIAKQIEDQDGLFAEEKKKLEEIIAGLVDDMDYEKEKAEKNTVLRLSLQTSVKEKLKVRKLDEKKVSEQNKVLQKAKGELAIKAEELAKLRQENMDMEQRTIELNETHEAIMQTLAKQIEECKAALAKERKERVALQDNRDDGQKKMDDVKIETSNVLNVMTRKINDGKKVHDDLTKEGQALQRAIKEDEERINALKADVEEYRQKLQRQKETQLGEVDQMEREISDMKRQEENMAKSIEDRTPPFQELEKDFAETEVQYDVVKKEVIARKNMKMGLEESVQRTHRDIEKLVYPRQQLRYTIKNRREDAIKVLKRQQGEVKEMENKIYDVGTRLRTAMEQNQRFHDANGKLRSDIARLHRDMANNVVKKEELDKYFKQLRGALENGWSEDRALNDACCARDMELVKELSDLLDTAAKREGVIGDVSTRLEGELAVLADFLENVAKRRPKEGKKSEKDGSSSGDGLSGRRADGSEESSEPKTTGRSMQSRAAAAAPAGKSRETTDVKRNTSDAKRGTSEAKRALPTVTSQARSVNEAVEQVAGANRPNPQPGPKGKQPLPAMKSQS